MLLASLNLAVTFDDADESIAKPLYFDINLQAWWRLDGNSTSEALEIAGHDGGPLCSPLSSMDQPERSENLARVIL